MMHSQKGKITMKTGKRTDDFKNFKKGVFGNTDPSRPSEDLNQTQLCGMIADGHLEYIYQYEQEYWLDFVIDLIKTDRIKYHEWANMMPWANNKAAEIIIERLIEKLAEAEAPTEKEITKHMNDLGIGKEGQINILDELRKKTAK